ncbi:MAG: DNA-binding protein [Clostridia bacterium]
MAFEKDLNMSLLLDIYGELLTTKQKDYLDYYYNEDMSLAEISEHISITRQGVRDSIKKGESTLIELEAKLNLAKKMSEISDITEKILIKANEIIDINMKKAFSSEIDKNATYIVKNANIIKSKL